MGQLPKQLVGNQKNTFNADANAKENLKEQSNVVENFKGVEYKDEEDQEIMTNFEYEESKDDQYQKVSYLKAICEVMFSGSGEVKM